ncbi:MAG: hypothetical protein NZ534_03520, partial [Bacteroidia bacterium]|nr:hypothetical protein [Bacteroidia bacterium]
MRTILAILATVVGTATVKGQTQTPTPEFLDLKRTLSPIGRTFAFEKPAVVLQTSSTPPTLQLRTGKVELAPFAERILVVGKYDAASLSRLAFVRGIYPVAGGAVLYADANASVREALFAAGEQALMATVFYRLGQDLWAPNGRIVARVKDANAALAAARNADYELERKLDERIWYFRPAPRTLSLPLSAAEKMRESGAFDYVEPDGVWLKRNAA